MKYLITGGAGFVGRHFVKRLLADGHDVTVVDNLVSGLSPEKWLDPTTRCWFYQADIRDFLRDSRFQWRTPPWDTIIHCAAIVGGRLTIENDPLLVATDLSIDAELFNWISKPANRDTKLIYFSSSAVYPIEFQTHGSRINLSEDMCDAHPRAHRLARPDFTYGWAKLTGEMLAHYAIQNYGVNVVIYRPFGGYGEGQSFDYPFPSIIRRVLNKENPIKVWGSGDQCRDFIHIDDIVEAVIKTKDIIRPGTALNLGTERPTSFRQLVFLAGSVLGIPVDVKNDVTKPEGVQYRVANRIYLSKYYVPFISLEEGIKRVAAALTFQKDGVV